MTKDIHEQCVGAIGAVQFFPVPIGANSQPPPRGVNFAKALRPLRVIANTLVCLWMEVPMPSVFSAPKDDAGNLSISAFMQESIHRRESETAQAEFAPQTYSIRNIEI